MKENYKYKVFYTKVFVDVRKHGVRAVRDSLRFVDWQSADQFRAQAGNGAVIRAIGGIDYRIEDAILEAI